MTTPLILVNSGAYVAVELSAEFGPLPPAFLPVGLSRLYELQARMLAPLAAELVLTLPASFDLPGWDAAQLRSLGFTVLRTPDTLSLGAALLYTLGRLGFQDRSLRILHGDTLLMETDLTVDDAVAVGEGGDGYRWAQVTLGPEGGVKSVSWPNLAADADGARPSGPHLCGYFAFASVRRFAENLALAGGDFIGALNHQAAATALGTIAPGRWLDFGHVQTFFRSRRSVTTERTFNSLEIGTMHVRKRSSQASDKLRAEASWLREVPAPLAPYCARVLSEGDDAQGYYYDSEYEYMPTLAELYVFGRKARASWGRVLGSCADFLGASLQAAAGVPPASSLPALVVDKTASRLEQLARDTGLDLAAPNTIDGRPAPSLERCLARIDSVLNGSGDRQSVMHGDFCFSNILYNFRTDRIRLIDPRGLTEHGGFSLHGDVRYDMAKLMHSICGRYDLIMAGHYVGGRTGRHAFELSFPQETWRSEVEAMARSLCVGGIRLDSAVVWAAMTSLFLSMPPLHADRPDRQAAFIANALRLQLELDCAA